MDVGTLHPHPQPRSPRAGPVRSARTSVASSDVSSTPDITRGSVAASQTQVTKLVLADEQVDDADDEEDADLAALEFAATFMPKQTFGTADRDTVELIGNSFNYFGPDSPFRKAVAKMITTRRWRTLCRVLIWVSLLCLLLEPRKIHGEERTDSQKLWFAFDCCVVVFFMVEILLNAIAWGFLQGTNGDNRTYLGGGLAARLNFTVLLLSVVFMAQFGLSGLHCLKALGSLPHTYFHEMRSARAVVQALKRSSMLLLNNVAVLCFFLYFFSLLSAEFFRYGMQYRCAVPTNFSGIDPVTGAWSAADYSLENLTILDDVWCAEPRPGLITHGGCPDVPAMHYPDAAVLPHYQCVRAGNEEPTFVGHFDSIGTAWLTNIQIIQMENWGVVMRPLLQTRITELAFWMIILMIVVCTFTMVNLFTAIVVLQLEELQSEMEVEDPSVAIPYTAWEKIKRDIYYCIPASLFRRAFPDTFTAIQVEERKKLEAESCAASPKGDSGGGGGGASPRSAGAAPVSPATGPDQEPPAIATPPSARLVIATEPPLAAPAGQAEFSFGDGSVSGSYAEAGPGESAPKHPRRTSQFLQHMEMLHPRDEEGNPIVDDGDVPDDPDDASIGSHALLSRPSAASLTHSPTASPRARRKSGLVGMFTDIVEDADEKEKEKDPVLLTTVTSGRRRSNALSMGVNITPAIADAPSRCASPHGSMRSMRSKGRSSFPQQPAPQSRGDQALYYFQHWVVPVVLLGNVAMLATVRVRMGPKHEHVLEVGEYCFLSFYVVELALRVWNERQDYVRGSMWYYEPLMIALAIPALFVKALHVFRTLRVFRLLRFSGIVRAIFQSVNFEPILSLFYIILVVTFLFAVIGRQFFSGLYDTKRYPVEGDWLPEEWESRFHFNDILSGMQTLFLIMAGDNWMYPTYQALQASSAIFFPSLLYFYGYMILSNWVLLSMFVAVLLQEFDLNRPVDKNIDNLAVVAESRNIFAGFLRKVDFGAAADNVDEESLTSIVAVSNMLKWANRARTERMRRIAYKNKIHLNPQELADTARVLEASSVAYALGTTIERVSNRRRAAHLPQLTAERKGANRFLKRDAGDGDTQFGNIVAAAWRQREDMEGICADTEQDLLVLESSEKLEKESGAMVRNMCDFRYFVKHSKDLRKVQALPTTDVDEGVFTGAIDDAGGTATQVHPASASSDGPGSPADWTAPSPATSKFRTRSHVVSPLVNAMQALRKQTATSAHASLSMAVSLLTKGHAKVEAAAAAPSANGSAAVAALPESPVDKQNAAEDNSESKGTMGIKEVASASDAPPPNGPPEDGDGGSGDGDTGDTKTTTTTTTAQKENSEVSLGLGGFAFPAIIVRDDSEATQGNGPAATSPAAHPAPGASVSEAKPEKKPSHVSFVEVAEDGKCQPLVMENGHDGLVPAGSGHHEQNMSDGMEGRQGTDPTEEDRAVLQQLQEYAAQRGGGGGWLEARNERLTNEMKRWALFLFHETHPVRLFALMICNSKAFEVFILIVVLVSSALQVFAPVSEAWGDDEAAANMTYGRRLSDDAEQAISATFLGIFTAEFLLKIVAYGFVWMARPVDPARKRERAYLHDPWNCLDFIILVLMWVSFGLRLGGYRAGLRSIRVFRVLRILRIIRRVSSLRRLVQTLLHPQTLLRIGAVMAFAGFLYFSFGLVSVSLFAGRLGRCSDDAIFERIDCESNSAARVLLLVHDGEGGPAENGTFAPSDPYGVLPNFTALHLESEDGYLAPRTWITPQRNFDTITRAMLSVIVIASGEDWGTPMLNVVDSTSETTGPVRNNRQSYALFFMAYMVLMSFLVVNLVIFVITDAIRSQSGTAVLIPEQVEWLDLVNHINVIRPLPRVPPPERDPVTRELTLLGRVRSKLLVMTGFRDTWQKTAFRSFIAVFIMVNMLIITLDYTSLRGGDDDDDGSFRKFQVSANAIIILVYIAELIIKIVSLRPSCYFQDKWNRLDFAVVLGSVLSVVLEHLANVDGDGLQVITLFRVFRVFYVFKAVKIFPGIAFLFDSIVASIPAIVNVLLIVVLFLWVWASIGTELFGMIKFREAINTEYNFRTFANSVHTLTLVITADDWITLMTDSMEDPRTCSSMPPRWVGPEDGGQEIDLSQGFSDCGSTITATIYYVSFFFLGAYVFLNVVTAAIVDEVRHAISRGNFRVSDEEIRDFRRVWYVTLHGTKGNIPRWRLPHLMESLFFHNKLGIHPTYHKKLFNSFVLRLDWHRLRRVATSEQNTQEQSNDSLRLMWPPPLWETFRFHDVLYVLCHHTYEHIVTTVDEVEEERSFQKKSDRLIATQVIQSVVRCICTLHLLELDRYPGYVLTAAQKVRLKQSRDRIRQWKSEIAAQLEQDAKLKTKNRLYRLPKVIREVAQANPAIDEQEDREARLELLGHAAQRAGEAGSETSEVRNAQQPFVAGKAPEPV